MTNQGKLWSVSGAAMLAISLVAFWVWPKFAVGDVHPIFGWAEARTGAGWLDPTGRYIFGVAAAALAVLLVLRPTRLAAAGVTLAVSLGFVVLHLTPWLGWNIPDYGPLTAALAAGQAVAEIEALGLKGDRGRISALPLSTLASPRWCCSAS
ncbi:hypothetical protein LRS10_11750 [Phenylobacterium sp. J426]|uniref:hypothetical protein n=1 Tax=Phenylobacterium sp. J426 TaxID=2898439 RepID=UPI00215092A8|nr:hypothetical protein [Phenylobacterium sp. J426]MCR5874781.1 hypothetical protein [Phenylobacterium sp. J426]